MSAEIEAGGESPSLAGSWRVLAGVGTLIAMLGVVAIFSPFVAGITLSAMLGVLLVVGGIGHGVHVFSARGWSGVVWQTVLAAVYIVGGIALFANPVVGLLTLTLLLAVFFLAEGVVEVVMGLELRPADGWGWMLGSGVVGIAAGALMGRLAVDRVVGGRAHLRHRTPEYGRCDGHARHGKPESVARDPIAGATPRGG